MTIGIAHMAGPFLAPPRSMRSSCSNQENPRAAPRQTSCKIGPLGVHLCERQPCMTASPLPRTACGCTSIWPVLRAQNTLRPSMAPRKALLKGPSQVMEAHRCGAICAGQLQPAERRWPLPRAGRIQRDSALIGLRSTPIGDNSTSHTSPSFIHSCGSRLTPTPPGVPVTSTSPGRSGTKVEQKAIR